MALIQDIQTSYVPFTSGALGQDPATHAYVQSFQQNTLPIIQNQMQMQGLGNGPAAGQAAGQSLAAALPSLLQFGAQNRLQATQGLTNLGSQLVLPSWQLQTGQQGQALNALQGAGQTLQGMHQNIFDAQQADLLRRQGLAESGTFGAFGSQQPTIRTQQSSGKGK